MGLRRLPLRVRLVAGFVVAMIVVLIGAGAFVYWRVEYALDHRLDQDLQSQTSDLRQAATDQAPAAALASLRDQGRDAQLLTRDGSVLATGAGLAGGRPLLTASQTRQAARGELATERGHLFSSRGKHLRILALPVHGDPAGAVAVSAVRLDQRDEALRELLAQLAIANLLALAVASFVGYRLARAALDPVERYRAQAETIAQGATGVRLDVPTDSRDEISRLGTTLNAMLDAQERSAERQRQFIDDASHELRTPLTTLLAEIDVALRKPRSAPTSTSRRCSGCATAHGSLSDSPRRCSPSARSAARHPTRTTSTGGQHSRPPRGGRVPNSMPHARSKSTRPTRSHSAPTPCCWNARSGTLSTTRSATATAPSPSPPRAGTARSCCAYTTKARGSHRSSSLTPPSGFARTRPRAAVQGPASASPSSRAS